MHDSDFIQELSFSGHESFPMRFSWLTKAVRHVTNDAAIFNADDAVVRLGVGKNMVRSIRYWATRSGMIAPVEDGAHGLEPTTLGAYLFGEEGVDPYLENDATVWLVHWGLTSKPSPHGSPTTWCYIFNLLRRPAFTAAEAVDELVRLSEERQKRPASRKTIERDVQCFLRSYLAGAPDKKISREESFDSPLVDLRLIDREADSDRLLLERAPRPTLPTEVFAYALHEFWSRFDSASETLTFEQITYAPGSPGQVFQLSENAAVEALEELTRRKTLGISYDSTAGLRQAYRHKKVARPVELLSSYFAEQSEFGVLLATQ